ncbi:MAG: tetratricopeptide repeat protein [Terracidiphilus sp.]|jgi:tetratricopeptide (TPR) repeat protein|nr:tetratricopeptide repeat protein [Terracidiphilus sp.]
MANQATTASTASETLRATQVYGMAAVCLAAGLAIGYLLGGTQSPVAGTGPGAGAALLSAPGGGRGGGAAAGTEANSGRPAQAAAGAQARSPHAGALSGSGRMPSLEEMKQMADKQAAPLKEKLKSDPNNTAVLMQVGSIYYTTHQFKEASIYYGRAVEADPGNVAFRTKLATGLYQSGDADGAIAELNKALGYDPKDANALFNLGLIRLQGKQDGKGAVAAWQKLLKDNPQMSADRKAQVQKLMADVMTTLAQDRK